jgi:hypothetical protein
VAHIALDGDGVEALDDLRGAADDGEAVLAAHFALDEGRRGEGAVRRLRKRLEERGVLELSHGVRMDAGVFEELLESARERRVFQREQERRARGFPPSR